MSIRVITPASQEPLTLAEVKADRRIDFADNDALLTQKIRDARAECEALTNLTLMDQTLRVTLNRFPAGPIRLPVWPVKSIVKVDYVDSAGATLTLAASEYQLVESAKPWLLAPSFGNTWPVTRVYYDSVLIDIVAGYGTDSSAVPADLLQAMLMIIGARDEHREDVVVGTIATKLPSGSDSIMRRHVFYG